MDEQYPHTPHAIGEPVLDISDLSGDALPAGVSLTLRRGEILGIAGIVGSGRTELLRAVYGLDPVRRGAVKVGTVVSDDRDTGRAHRAGVGNAERGSQDRGAGAGDVRRG